MKDENRVCNMFASVTLWTAWPRGYTMVADCHWSRRLRIITVPNDTYLIRESWELCEHQISS